MQSVTMGEGDRSRRLAIWAGVAVVAITTLQFVAARFSLREHLTAADIVTLRFSGAALAFLPVFLSVGLPKLMQLGWRKATVLALLTGLPYPLIINQGLSLAPVAHAAALSPAVIVFFSFLFSRLVFKDKASGTRLAGVATVIAGLFLFVLQSGVADAGT
ncbi:MAG: EamA family transporter, partial [Ensifer adhaerens]